MPERAVRLLLSGLGVLLAVTCALLTYLRAVEGRYDFHHFQLEAAYVWEHGALNPDLDHPDPDRRRQLPFYLPTVPVLIAWLGPLGRSEAALAWTVLQVAALLGSYVLLRGWAVKLLAPARTNADADTDTSRSTEADADSSTESGAGAANTRRPALAADGRLLALVAALLCAGAILEAAKFNQLSFPVLFLLVAGVTALPRRPGLGGALLGFAAVLKLLPALLLVWLLLKRQWRAAGAAAATFVLAAVLPPLLLFGAARTWDYHRDWWHYNVQRSGGAHSFNADEAAHFFDHRNQSLAAVLARLRGDEPSSLTLLSPSARLGQALAAVLLAALLVSLRRPWDSRRAPLPCAEAAVCALAMLALSPLVRTYYLVWAWPAVLLALAGWVRNTPPVSTRCAGVLIVWMLGMIGWAFPAARLYGIHLWMLIAMAALLLSIADKLSCRPQREPNQRDSNLPAPCQKAPPSEA